MALLETNQTPAGHSNWVHAALGTPKKAKHTNLIILKFFREVGVGMVWRAVKAGCIETVRTNFLGMPPWVGPKCLLMGSQFAVSINCFPISWLFSELSKLRFLCFFSSFLLCTSAS